MGNAPNLICCRAVVALGPRRGRSAFGAADTGRGGRGRRGRTRSWLGGWLGGWLGPSTTGHAAVHIELRALTTDLVRLGAVIALRPGLARGALVLACWRGRRRLGGRGRRGRRRRGAVAVDAANAEPVRKEHEV